MTVRCLVEGQIKVELECVTLLHPNSEEMIAQLMDHQIRKHKDAMKILVQVKTILFWQMIIVFKRNSDEYL